MPTKNWQKKLHSQLHAVRPANRPPRVVLMGIGHELRGDDAAGVEILRALQAQLPHRENLLLLDAGPAPENFTGAIRKFSPEVVVMIDSAQMDEDPGVVRWIPWEETDGLSASTHTLPPHVIGLYLVSEIGCSVALIGIQPAQNDFGVPLSDPVRQAVEAVVDGLTDMLG